MKVFIAICLVALVYAEDSDKDNIVLDELAAPYSSNIVSGQKAGQCEFPSIVSLKIVKRGRHYMCGGTLIDRTHVLTAAHCIAGGVQQVKVSLGSNNVGYPRFVDYATNAKPHENFYTTAKALHNDVAMLTLGKPVPVTDCMKPIPLASRSDSFEQQTCVTAGWGKTAWTMPTSQLLRKVNLPIMPYSECHRMWPHVKHEHICAGDWIPGGASPCQGDSGGPLYCQSNGRWVLAGIVSFGLKCEYGPAVYTNVAYFRDWIDSHR